MIKTFIILYLILFSNQLYSSEKSEIIKNDIQINLGKCKFISHNKILEISIKTEGVLFIEKDYLTNKICLRARKIGSSEVTMLLSDGRGFVKWRIAVVQPVLRSNKKKVRSKPNASISKFDKDLNIFQKVPGW